MTEPTPTHDDGRTMRERMMAGDLYIFDDPALYEAMAAGQALARRYNALYGEDNAAAEQVLHELLDHCGEGVHIRAPFYVDYGRHISIGSGTFANFGLVALDVARITIGRDVQIGPNVQLLTPTHPIDPDARRDKWESARPITIGDNVWLGGGVIVGPGVTIGENSVIGAGSVVVKDIPPNVVAVGTPARAVRSI